MVFPEGGLSNNSHHDKGEHVQPYGPFTEDYTAPIDWGEWSVTGGGGAELCLVEEFFFFSGDTKMGEEV